MKIRFCLEYDGQNHSEVMTIDSDKWDAMGPVARTTSIGEWAISKFDYWSEPIEDSMPKSIDFTGLECLQCKEGFYMETSIQDDLDGKLHCSNCNHEVNRWN